MKLKRFYALALSLSALLLTLTACGNAGGGQSTPENTSNLSSENQTEERQVLRVGMECAYAPFNWTQETAELSNGAVAVPIQGTQYYAYGYDVMVAQMIADTLGWDLEIYKVDWASIGMGLDVGDYDCIIAGMGYTEERAALYEFTSEYYLRDLCITVNANGRFADVTKLSEFAGQSPSVITQMGTAWVDHVTDIPDAKPGVNYESTAECFMAISTNVADVCLVDYPTSVSAALTDANLKVLTLDADDALVQDDSSRVCIATKKGNTELRDLIDEALTENGWNQEKMNEYMDLAIDIQPSVS